MVQSQIYNKKNSKLYVGETADVERRIIEHNQKRGKHFTAKFEGEWVLIHTESLATRSEALKREKRLKSYRGREYLRQLV